MYYSKKRLTKKRLTRGKILIPFIIILGLIYIPLKITKTKDIYSNSSISKYELINKLKEKSKSNYIVN